MGWRLSISRLVSIALSAECAIDRECLPPKTTQDAILPLPLSSLSCSLLPADGHLLLLIWAGSHASGLTTSPDAKSPTKEAAAETFASVLHLSTSSLILAVDTLCSPLTLLSYRQQNATPSLTYEQASP